MPQRFLRPGITNSERFNTLAMPTQSLFVRLLTIVDDFGRCDGRPAVIHTHCFTIWNVLHPEPEHAVNVQQVAEMLQELAGNCLIEVYFNPAERKTVLQILQWSERIRPGVKEKWPAKDSTSVLLFATDDETTENRPINGIPDKLQQDSGDLLQLSGDLQEIAGNCRKFPPSSSSSASSSASASASASPPTVPQGGHELVVSADEAKELICKHVLNGKNPSRAWSYDADAALARQLPIPRREIKLVSWFHGLPADDQVIELRARRQSESTLMPFWSDEVTRAAAYRKKIGVDKMPSAKKEPRLWREFFRWKYGDEINLPAAFGLLGADQRSEWERDNAEFESWCALTGMATT